VRPDASLRSTAPLIPSGATAPSRITGILNGAPAITAGTAIRLGARFGTTAEFWMNLQMAHDLEMARMQRAA
jgi:addiction module HigA family antidote